MSGQEVDQDTLVGDYKDFDGVKRYTKMTIKRDGSDFIQMQASDYKTPESLPANTFDKPGQ
jgi:hypothetical protein